MTIEMALKARVQDGRLILNEPTDLPEGTVMELEEVDLYRDFDHTHPFVDMTPEERQQLSREIAISEQEFDEGKGIPVQQALVELRSMR